MDEHGRQRPDLALAKLENFPVASCGPEILPPPPGGRNLAPGLCGNDRRDSYTAACNGGYRGGGDGGAGADAGGACQASTYYETCDGPDLGGATCESLGYAGGALACGSCSYDWTGCESCLHGSGVLGCTLPFSRARGHRSLALASSDGEIALAYIADSDGGGRSGLHLSRFRRDLSLIEDSGCFGPPGPNTVALAATRLGYVLAVDNRDGLYVYTLDTKGTVKGPIRFMAGASRPMLVARPTAGPLLGWAMSTGAGANFLVALLDENAEMQTVPATAFVEQEAGFLSFAGNAVFTGSGFLIAEREWAKSPHPPNFDGLVVVHVDLNGSIDNRIELAESAEDPYFAWTGSEARLVYNSFGGAPTVYLARLDERGRVLGKPSVIFDKLPDYSPTGLAALDGDSVLLHPPHQYSGNVLQIMRLDARGVARGKAVAIARDPHVADFTAAQRNQMLVLDGEIFVAFLSASTDGGEPAERFMARIGLARVKL